MADTTVANPQKPSGPKPRRAAKFAWGTYQQVAAIFGAFSMAVFFGEVFEVGWRGFLAKIVGVWSDYVRPVFAWLFHWIVWPFNYFFDWHIEVPALLRDYFAVGVILAFSLFRVFLLPGLMSERSWADVGAAIAIIFGTIVAWPVLVGLYLFFLVFKSDDLEVAGALRTLSPLVYLALLLLANFLFL